MRLSAAQGALVSMALVVGLVSASGASTPVAAVSEARATVAAVSSGQDPSPLVVLLDISGSMADSVDASDGSGTVVKLDEAKEAISETIRAQPAGVGLGIWTYPGTPSCDPGSWLLEVGTNYDPAQVLERVESLSTDDGGTSTAEAIQAAVDSLRADGIMSANIVLVSDGESNCEDPCETAKNLTDTGFELSIQTVGFDISPQGKQELECIAAAAHGQYIDVSDGATLRTVIRGLTTPKLQVTVSGDPEPRAGEVTLITAIVKNPSAYTAYDVKLNLSFRDAGPQSLSPAFVPATIRIGALQPGASARRSWTFVAGTRSRVSDASYAVTAWGDSTGTYQVSGQFRTTAVAYSSEDVGDVLSSIGAERSLVILGDSYSSGEGTQDYLPASSHASEDCHRSSQTYLAPLYDASGTRVEILACSGAVTSAMTSQQWDGEGRWRADRQDVQFAQLGSIPGAVVTTIGGNDIGFGQIVESCVTPFADECGRDETSRNQLLRNIAEQQDSISDWYRHAWNLANTESLLSDRDGEFAPVIVLGYPQATLDDKFGSCTAVNMSAFEMRYANEVTRALNATIKAAVESARADGFEVYYVDRTVRAFQPDHSVCGQEPWINGIQLEATSPDPLPVGGKQESLHPNVYGYQAITAAVIGWSRTVERVPPDTGAIAESGYIGADPGPASAINDAWSAAQAIARVDLDQGAATTVSPLQRVDVSGSGFAPGSVVLARVGSQSTTLGPLVANKDGAVQSVLVIPADIELGSHHFMLSGTGPDGRFRELSLSLTIVPQFPIWLVGALALAGLCLVGAVVLTLLARRVRRSRSSPEFAGVLVQAASSKLPEQVSDDRDTGPDTSTPDE